MKKFLLIFLICLTLPISAWAIKNEKDDVTMFCPRCKIELTNNGKFCTECGEVLTVSTSKAKLEELRGTWVCADAAPNYTIIIYNDEIIILFANKVVCDTKFRIEKNELKNTKKRENWEKYAEPNQYEQFGHFKYIRILDNKLVGFLFEADSGYYEFSFKKTN